MATKILTEKERTRLKEIGVKKGQRLPGAGRKPVPKELVIARDLTAQVFQDTVNKMFNMSYLDMKKHIFKKECSALEAAVAGQIKSAAKGSAQSLALLLDRKIGAVQRSFNLHVTGGIGADIPQKTEQQIEKELQMLEERLGELEKQEAITVECRTISEPESTEAVNQTSDGLSPS